MMHFSNNGKKA